MGIRDFNYLSSDFLHCLEYLTSEFGFRARLPVVAVDYEVGTQPSEIRNITPVILRNHFADAFDVLHNFAALVVVQEWKALMGCYGAVCEQSDYKLAMACALGNDAVSPGCMMSAIMPRYTVFLGLFSILQIGGEDR